MYEDKLRNSKVNEPPTGKFFHGGPICADYDKGDTIRTIWFSQEKGLKARYDISKRRVISFLFDKKKWTKTKAEAWTKKHDVCRVNLGEKEPKPRGKPRPAGNFLREGLADRYALDLPEEFAEFFNQTPETGMGYHAVDLQLRNGETIRGCIVMNGSKLIFPEGSRPVHPLEIEEMLPRSTPPITVPDDFLSEASGSAATRKRPKLLLPRRLSAGGTIGVTAPSSNVPPAKIARGVEWLREWGYRVKLGATVVALLDHDMTSASDRVRAQDLMNLFEDDEVDAILTATGGYGAARLLKHLDFNLIKKHPKPISGFSDATALLNAITLETGLVTFLGPTIEIREDNESRATKYLQALLGLWTKPREGYEVLFPPELAVIRRLPTASGSAPSAGRLYGGNLTLVSRLCGTAWQLPGEDSVIALEEIGEAAFMIDSILQQLEDAGTILEETPIIFGDFSAIPTEHGSTRGPEDGDAAVYDVLRQRYSSHRAPALVGWPFSHGRWNLTLPLGVRVRVDPAARTMFVLEPVVR